jgi:hypothetical protein
MAALSLLNLAQFVHYSMRYREKTTSWLKIVEWSSLNPSLSYNKNGLCAVLLRIPCHVLWWKPHKLCALYKILEFYHIVVYIAVSCCSSTWWQLKHSSHDQTHTTVVIKDSKTEWRGKRILLATLNWNFLKKKGIKSQSTHIQSNARREKELIRLRAKKQRKVAGKS